MRPNAESSEYQELLKKKKYYKIFKDDYADMMWVDDTLTKLEKKGILDYWDYETLDKARAIAEKVLKKAQASETRESHTTTHYIWRTQDDGKVRSRHAQFDDQIFSWNNPPAGGYHPGEDYGCRCWAEAYVAEDQALQERMNQTVTVYTTSSQHTWNDDDLRYHYFNGKGKGLFLGHIGLLQGVINYARTQTQKSGGSIFDRVARKIFIEARQNGEGIFNFKFGTSYDFSQFLFSLGDSTVEGDSQVKVTEKEGFLIISADIHYTFWDEYKDPLDIFDVVPGSFELPGGMPYKITDAWSTHLEAVIKKDSSKSKYSDGEFGNLH